MCKSLSLPYFAMSYSKKIHLDTYIWYLDDLTDFSSFHKWLIVLNHHVCPEVALVCSLHKKEDVQDPEEAEHWLGQSVETMVRQSLKQCWVIISKSCYWVSCIQLVLLAAAALIEIKKNVLASSAKCMYMSRVLTNHPWKKCKVRYLPTFFS